MVRRLTLYSNCFQLLLILEDTKSNYIGRLMAYIGQIMAERTLWWLMTGIISLILNNYFIFKIQTYYALQPIEWMMSNQLYNITIIINVAQGLSLKI